MVITDVTCKCACTTVHTDAVVMGIIIAVVALLTCFPVDDTVTALGHLHDVKNKQTLWPILIDHVAYSVWNDVIKKTRVLTNEASAVLLGTYPDRSPCSVVSDEQLFDVGSVGYQTLELNVEHRCSARKNDQL